MHEDTTARGWDGSPASRAARHPETGLVAWRRAAACLALSLAVSALARAEDPPAEYLAHLRHARTHVEQGRGSRAVVELRRAVQVWPAGAEAWRELARIVGERGDRDLALLCAVEAKRRAPEDAEADTLLAEARGRRSGGPARRVLLRYVGMAGTDGRRDDVGSVAAGAELASGCLLALALDAAGNPVESRLAWSAGAGLEVDSTGQPVRVRAGAKPCDPTLTVRLEGDAEVTATVPIRVVGPPASIQLTPVEVEAHAGERLHLRLGAADEAGHRLWLPEVAWSVEGAGDPPAAALGRSGSIVPQEDYFESHRNTLEVRREGPPAPGTKFRVVATGDAGRERFAAAVRRSEEYEKGFPAASRLAKTVYWRGLALLRLGRKAEARAAWEAVNARWPGDPVAKSALEGIERSKR